MTFRIDLYKTEEGQFVKIDNALWKDEYTAPEALELITTLLYNKFSDEVTGIIINRNDKPTDLEDYEAVQIGIDKR